MVVGRTARSSEGMTLIEIMIVVIFLAILAAIIIPACVPPVHETENVAFMTSLNDMVRAFQFYRLKNGGYPADTAPGLTPPEMKHYLRPDEWAAESPIGGRWNWDYATGGVTAAVGVQDPDRDEEEMAEIDESLDDGNLSTGAFRKTSGGYMFVLED